MNVDGRIRNVIATELGIDPGRVTMRDSFKRDLGADSLDVVDIFMAVEEEFEFMIPDDDSRRITTVGGLARYVKSRMQICAQKR